MTTDDKERMLEKISQEVKRRIVAIVDPRRDRDPDVVSAEVYAVSKVLVWAVNEIVQQMQRGVERTGTFSLQNPLDSGAAAMANSAPAVQETPTNEAQSSEHIASGESAEYLNRRSTTIGTSRKTGR